MSDNVINFTNIKNGDVKQEFDFSINGKLEAEGLVFELSYKMSAMKLLGALELLKHEILESEV